MFFNRCKYENRFYWSFKEVLVPAEGTPDYVLGESYLLTIVVYMKTQGYSTPLVNNSNQWSKPEYQKLADLLVKRYLNSYCFYTLDENFDSVKANNFIGKLLYIMEMTSPRYLTLLKAYDDNKDLLLAPVQTKTSGTNRFNDTPQDEGDFANDEHTTNISEMENVIDNDLDSKMGRIREIESNYSNLMLNWSNEFESIFIEEANL